MVLLWSCASPLPETQINTSTRRIVKPLPSFFRTKPSPLSRADSSHMAGVVLDYYLQAADLQLRDQHEDAIKVFKRILHLDTSAMIFYSMGLSYQALLKTDLAIESMQKAIALNSQLIIAREALAELYVNHEQYDKALNSYKQLDSIKPDIKYTYALAALTEFLNPEESEKHFKKLVNTTGYETDIVNRYGMLLVRNGKEDTYITLLKEHYAIHPDNAKARSLLIEGLQLYGRMEEALVTIEEFLPTALDEELEVYYQSILMNILIRNDQTIDKAIIEQHVKAIQRYTTSSWITRISAALLAEYSELDIASILHEQAVNVADTSHLKQSVGLAYELMRIEKDSLFIAHCLRYAKKYPEESRFHFLLGIHYREIENFKEATSALEESLRRNPKEGDAWAELGGIYGDEQAFQSSDSCFREALKVDSLNVMYNNNYAYALSERNERLQEALGMSLLAISQYPDNQSFLDTYAWIQFKLGNAQSAIDILQQALQKDTDRSGIMHFHLSQIYQSLSQKDQAIEQIEKALEIKNDSEYQVLRAKLLQD
jgi:tetratricopeptide (TPR) repeat protein